MSVGTSQRARHWRRPLLALLLSLLFLYPAVAATLPPLRLEQASRRALAANPQLEIFAWQSQAAAGQRLSADQSPAYAIGIGAENMLGSGELSGSDRAELNLSLSSVVELGGKRSARIAVASSREALTQARQQAAALDLLGKVTQRYIATLALQEKLAVAEQASQLAQTAYQLVSRRVKGGGAPEAEQLRARASLSQARLHEAALAAGWRSHKLALAVLWGAENADFERLEGELFQFPKADSFEALYQRVIDTPALAVYAQQARLREAEVELARSQASADISWSLGVRHFQESGDSALVAGLSVPLFSASRNRGEVQSARAERQLVQVEKEAALLALRARLFEAWQTYRQSRAAALEMRRTILPALEQALSQTRTAYEQGRYRYQDWVSARAELLTARVDLINAASTALLNQALIEQLTAQPLSQDAATAPHGNTPMNSDLQL